MGTTCKDLHVYYMEKSNARRLSWQWCQKNAPEVAFLDPQVVTFTNLENDRQGMVNYIYDTLWSHREKEYIMYVYNQYAHWILLVITPKWSTCHYLNSRIDKQAFDWTPIQLAIDEAWGQYVQRGGLRKTGHDTLIQKKDFSMKQQIGDQCGFYVCHNMRLLYREKAMMNID
uniref:Uncharacterized protein n=1 Tax=Oryza sativa subsp. japonica TaxID=39947 RepID=Q7XFN7_ORYSJ|nr:hypothetical protein LOC_Os10g18710 [Oryza sativa Japonica Group]